MLQALCGFLAFSRATFPSRACRDALVASRELLAPASLSTATNGDGCQPCPRPLLPGTMVLGQLCQGQAGCHRSSFLGTRSGRVLQPQRSRPVPAQAAGDKASWGDMPASVMWSLSPLGTWQLQAL